MRLAASESDLPAAAVRYAAQGWRVLPLRGKLPLIPSPHPDGDRSCRGECGLDGHGVLDATDDLGRVVDWWATYPKANIGGRVPEGCLVLDVDPRSGGLDGLAELERRAGGSIGTLTAWSGRGDGGRHLYFKRGALAAVSAERLPAGVDLKTSAGYCVLPPSVHPATGDPYLWGSPVVEICPLPAGLAALLRREPVATRPPRPPRTGIEADSVADWYSQTFSDFGHVLDRHGWRRLDDDGLRWRHPTATSALSATVSDGSLYVYSTNTPFEPTEAGRPHGYSPFAAFAVLEHGGDRRAAARAARELRNRMEVLA